MIQIQNPYDICPQLEEILRFYLCFAKVELGTCVIRKDTKEVLCLSNYHKGELSKVKRKQKRGEKVHVDCPANEFDSTTSTWAV